MLGNQDYKSLTLTDTIYGTVCWAFAKDSEFVELFNYHLHKLDESGFIARKAFGDFGNLIFLSTDREYFLRRTWKNWTYKPAEQFWVSEAIVLGYNNTLFPFLCLCAGILSAAAFCLCEKASLLIKYPCQQKS